MPDKKYSDEDVKRIVQEALRQSKEQEEDDRRIIKESMDESKETEQPDEDDEWTPPSHWRKSESDNSNKPVKVKEQNISEMRFGCGFLFIILPILTIIFIYILFAAGP